MSIDSSVEEEEERAHKSNFKSKPSLSREVKMIWGLLQSKRGNS